jgi:D-glycerate 3-kinase
MDSQLDCRLVQPLLAQLQGLGRSNQRSVVALNGPVGAGKSTIARVLQQQAALLGLRLAVASIDDFYLPWEQRQRALEGNPFGVSRVPPGSHDVALALECLDAWQAGRALRLPRFDKTLRGGLGDRAAEEVVEAEVLLLEGWLLGCRSLGRESLANIQNPMGLNPEELAWLPHWDMALETYQPLWLRCSQLWLLRPHSWLLPHRWRLQAEAAQRRRGGAWLPVAELNRLVRSSLCSLPASIYQDPLLDIATGYAVLDGRRRWVGGGYGSAQ